MEPTRDASSLSTTDRDDLCRRTRLAPSPTGALHLGNARTFLVNWALARQRDWRIVLRIDDLDGPRVKAGADVEAIEMLEWLGLDWDEGPYYQTAATERYRAALERLAARGAIYPCRCTRTQIQAAALSAPHAGDHELRYPGTCRPVTPLTQIFPPASDMSLAWRLRVPTATLHFDDELAGPQSSNPAADVGDFLVSTKQAIASYQLAVVVDDAAQTIDAVVRGDDLLSSTFRQGLLYDVLELGPRPKYWHLPLVVGTDGRRLAKRHGDSRLLHYRRAGVAPQRILGLLAEWCGLGPRRELTIAEFLARFDCQRLADHPIVFTPADDAWLLG